MVIMKSQPRVGVGVFIKNKEGKYAFLQRQGAHGAGTWALAGGALEFKETFEGCAQREVMEEMGIEIDDIQFLTATNNNFSENDSHWITILLLAQHKEGELKIMEKDKCTDMGWFTLEEIQEKELFSPLDSFFSQEYNKASWTKEIMDFKLDLNQSILNKLSAK